MRYQPTRMRRAASYPESYLEPQWESCYRPEFRFAFALRLGSAGDEFSGCVSSIRKISISGGQLFVEATSNPAAQLEGHYSPLDLARARPTKALNVRFRRSAGFTRLHDSSAKSNSFILRLLANRVRLRKASKKLAFGLTRTFQRAFPRRTEFSGLTVLGSHGFCSVTKCTIRGPSVGTICLTLSKY